jgi:hypothetical protein
MQKHRIKLLVFDWDGTLAVSYGVHDSTRLLKYKPLACLASLSDLLDWLPAPH